MDSVYRRTAESNGNSCEEVSCWSYDKSGENQMRELIMVVATKPEEYRTISAILESNHYGTVACHSLFALPKDIREAPCGAVILDLDSLPVDNRFIRDFRKHNAELPIIALSSRSFHPELQEALSLYISACLAKPVDSDELIYWVKSICQEHVGSEDSISEGKRINGLG
jgi:DNA-binding response OmpR family regulator